MHHPRLAQLGLVLLLFAIGCSESALTSEPVRPGDALHGMSDGAHTGIEGFYFLAPVKDPTYSGAVDADPSPLVDVCAIVNSLISRVSSRTRSFAWFPPASRCAGI